MSSNFVKNSKPKTVCSKGYQMWQHMLLYEPTEMSKQQQNRRNKLIQLRKITVVELEKNVINNNQSILEKFMVYDWGNEHFDVNYPKEKIQCLFNILQPLTAAKSEVIG